ncbi:MAG: sulfurtransferase [Gammaproteobacteria bacterium]|nr:sulfurtransferase [Gammaproteobacteria bacterium]
MKNHWSKTHVGVDELRTHLDDPKWVVVDCRFDLMKPVAGLKAYEAGHIPGAVYADLDRDLAASVAGDGAGGRHPLPDPTLFGRLLESWGIGSDSIVVVYDDIGNAVSARLWWLLRWVGHQGVAVLDGGLTAWLRAEGPMTTMIKPPEPGKLQLRPGSMPVVDAELVEAGLSADNLLLMDARAAARFAGQSEPIDRLAGHVPGAINTPFQDNLSADKCFLPAADLQAYYRPRIGARPMQEVACMCGSGVTACHTLLALETAGLHGASLYVGSWSDWISGEQRPVAGE